MYNLALVGKNISHSKSGEMYKKILGDKLSSYDLLDFESVDFIPSLESIFLKYNGLSITSPYKEYFTPKVHLDLASSKIGAVNCIRFQNGIFEGTNTDHLATVDLLNKILIEFTPREIIILGDGVMSRLVQLVLAEFKKEFKVYSRKTTNDFEQLSILDKGSRPLVINACSRDYIFKAKVDQNVYFWDLNYNLHEHKSRLKEKCHYTDGLELLELQARYAASFWSGNLII